MENFFTATPAKMAGADLSRTVDATEFRSKRKYFPPMAECLEVGTMAILAGSGSQGSPSSGFEVGAKEVEFEDMESSSEQDFTFDYPYTE